MRCIIRIYFLLLSFFLQPDAFFAQNVSSSPTIPDPHLTDINLLKLILKSNQKQFSKMSNNFAKYKIQIIYTQINRDSANTPSFKSYTYGDINNGYFYPASLVKLPLAVLALQKINSLKSTGITSNSIMITDSAYNCQKAVSIDSTAQNCKPSIAQYIKRILLVSDNEAYNRVYEFLGQEYIHTQLAAKGYSLARILNRFDSKCNFKTNRFTNPISFLDATGKLLYRQELTENKQLYAPPLKILTAGKAYLDSKDKYVKGSKDFTTANYLSLTDITEILKSIIFPLSVIESERFDIDSSDRLFLMQYMSLYPRESGISLYKTKNYWDSFKKYFIYGRENKSAIDSDTLRIFNIVGQSYGFLSDCAYIVDFKNNIEFMLSAVIYVNNDGVINDNKYEYKEIGFPFLLNLSNAIYNFEKIRPRPVAPNLDEYKINH